MNDISPITYQIFQCTFFNRIFHINFPFSLKYNENEYKILQILFSKEKKTYFSPESSSNIGSVCVGERKTIFSLNISNFFVVLFFYFCITTITFFAKKNFFSPKKSTEKSFPRSRKWCQYWRRFSIENSFSLYRVLWEKEKIYIVRKNLHESMKI